jgi:uncharacterized protein YqgV (UPF0045/DUF77 family)
MIKESAMISAQFALYPLRSDQLEPILDQAVAAARTAGVDVEMGSMSSTMLGTEEQVFTALRAAFEVAARSNDVVLVATVSNACPVE